MKFEDSSINHWFAGDFHYWHKNICKGESSWNDKSGCRNFADRREMSTYIVDQVNKHVMPNDILWFGGDWSFGGIQNVWNLRKRLNVKTIYFCIGNHDSKIKDNKILPNVVRDGAGFLVDYNGEEDLEFTEVRAQELFTDVQPMYEIQIHGQRITLCHYSMKTWYFHNKGSWMLFGHSHGSLQPEGKTMDVGIDNLHDNVLGEYRPIKFQEIQKIMSKKEFVQVDSHDPKTNA